MTVKGFTYTDESGTPWIWEAYTCSPQYIRIRMVQIPLRLRVLLCSWHGQRQVLSVWAKSRAHSFPDYRIAIPN